MLIRLLSTYRGRARLFVIPSNSSLGTGAADNLPVDEKSDDTI